MAIKRVSLSWVGVSDFAKAKSFFVETLGLKVTEVHEQYGWMELQGEKGGQILGVGAASPDCEMKPGINAIVTFMADDYEKTKVELTQKGLKLFGEVGGSYGVPRMISFKDADGNSFQLVEETPGHTDKV